MVDLKPATQQHANPTTEQKRAEKPATGKTQDAEAWKRGEILDALTLLVTAFFLFFTVLTWKEMVRANNNTEKSNQENDRHTEESLRLTRESNEETRRAVKYAERQATSLAAVAAVQERSLELQTRAWLVCMSVEHSIDEVMDRMVIRVIVKNVGHGVPATRVRTEGVAWVMDKQAPPPTNAQLERPGHASVGVLGAGASTAVTVPTNIAYKVRSAIMDGEQFLYVAGSIIYDDMFGVDRSTTFCAKYTPPRYSEEDGFWSPASEGNELT